jgi:Tol biopolymer transport system component
MGEGRGLWAWPHAQGRISRYAMGEIALGEAHLMTVMTRVGIGTVMRGAGLLLFMVGVGHAGGLAPPAADIVAPGIRDEQTPRGREMRSGAPAVDVMGEFDGATRRVPASFGEAGFQEQTFLSEGADADVAVDPGGKWIAYTSTRHSEHPALYIQRTNGVSVTQLTSDGADAATPCFSPDGKQIAFSSTRSGNWNIYVMDVDGRNVMQITEGTAQDMHPSYSPDGTRLVYSSLGKNNQWELWTVSLTTGEKRMIGYGLFPSWSPDKAVDRIAFQRSRQRGSHFFSLWTLDLIDGEARRPTEVTASNNAAIVSPGWSPDGKKLAFTTILDPKKGADGKTVGQQDVWIVNADGTGRRRLTDGNGTNLTPFWAVDNRVYFVSDRGGNQAIWSVLAGEPMTATANAGKKAAPAEGKTEEKKKASAATDEKEVAP